MKLGKPRLIQIYIDDQQKKDLKRWCFQNDITMSQQIRRLIKHHLVEAQKAELNSDTR